MRIKGLGPKSIEKLGLVRPIEIYDTLEETYIEILGEKIGQKVYAEIENSCEVPLATFLAALSIPLIGDSASKKIVAHGFTSVTDILSVDYIDGIGPKAEESLYNYIEENKDELQSLESYFRFGLVAQNVIKPGSAGKVCITGKLKEFANRNAAKEFLEQHGYTVTSTLSGATDYLVCEDGSNSSKTKKAESLEVPIVSIDDLIG
jgi:DNA ligase (NAD+)